MTVTAGVDLLRAREDLGVFGQAVGLPLTECQAEALRLESLFTVLVAPRQTGKSRSLSLLACWWAVRRPGQVVLVVSASEDAAKRLLRQVRAVLEHPLLADVVADEQAGVVVLSNGSQIRAVPASDKAIRGWSVDLLLVDEAAWVSDDLLEGAALPTTGARPDARIVLSSSPWDASGFYYRMAMLGEAGDDPGVRTFRWSLRDAPWITEDRVRLMRLTMSPLRFRAEYEAEFVDGGSGLFSRTALLEAVADYGMRNPLAASGGNVVLGCDWGNRRDSHAVVALGVLDDHGANGAPVLFLPWVESSQVPYSQQIDLLARYAGMAPRPAPRRAMVTYEREQIRNLWQPGMERGYRVDVVVSETNGVGGPATERLAEALRGRGTQVVGVTTTQRSKEVAFARLQELLDRRRIVLPRHDGLLRELAGLEAQPTGNGGQRIAAAGTGHDDLAMALSFTLLADPARVFVGPPSQPRGEVEWLRTESGLRVPRRPAPRWGRMADPDAFLRSESQLLEDTWT